MHIGGSVNWWNYYEKQYGVSSKNKNRINVWPSNFTSGHLSEEENTNLNICTPVFVEALFVIARCGNKCPTEDKWIKTMWYIYHIYIYNEILVSQIKEWNFAIQGSRDGPRGYYVQGNKSDKDKYYIISFMHGIWKTKHTNKTLPNPGS